MDIDKYDLYTAGAEGQDAGPSLDYMTHLYMTMNQLHLQPEEDIYTASDEIPQPSAPLDMAKFKIKVDWTEPFPVRWRARLQIALQRWLSRLEGTISVHSLELMDDPSCAEVQITPSAALKTLKYHRTASLKLKDNKDGKVKGDKEVIAQICLDEAHSVTVPQRSLLKKNKAPSYKVNRTKPVTSAVSEDTNNSEDVAAANRALKDAEITKSFEMTHETSSRLSVPLHQFWYMLHVYKKELELIEKQHGVSLHSELSVSFKSTQKSSSGSVSKASEDLLKLLSECVDSCSYADINHNDMDSDIVKEIIRSIQSEKTKMMFTMSAGDCQFFGPKKFTDMIKRETTRENQFKIKSNEIDVDSNVSRQSRYPLDMDTKDLQSQLEMDKVHWDLMKLSYKDQLSQLETKYGVLFHEDKQQKNVIKVQARFKRDQHIILEGHALRALTNLYQKLASAAVSCELTQPTNKTDVAPIVKELQQQQQHCVVAADLFSSWKLVGLPEHLGPAIADIEKKLKKHVFDDKMKKLIGYSGDIPHARGFMWNQTPDYSPGAVAGAGRDERVYFRGQDEADTGFNEDSKDSRYDSKGAQAEEETCTICMDSFTDKTKLKCGHEFCQECIKMSVKSLGPICPVCKEVFGRLEGNQPDGTMKVTKSRLSLPGYPQCGTIEIHYNIPSGIQTKKHPNPGKPYCGIQRRAYLPDNREGNEVLRLLQMAFQQNLIFTVWTSTTGTENAVTWNDIHHKTSTYGGPLNYGYPDPHYLKRVKDELKAKGIE